MYISFALYISLLPPSLSMSSSQSISRGMLQSRPAQPGTHSQLDSPPTGVHEPCPLHLFSQPAERKIYTRAVNTLALAIYVCYTRCACLSVCVSLAAPSRNCFTLQSASFCKDAFFLHAPKGVVMV